MGVEPQQPFSRLVVTVDDLGGVWPLISEARPLLCRPAWAADLGPLAWHHASPAPAQNKGRHCPGTMAQRAKAVASPAWPVWAQPPSQAWQHRCLPARPEEEVGAQALLARLPLRQLSLRNKFGNLVTVPQLDVQCAPAWRPPPPPPPPRCQYLARPTAALGAGFCCPTTSACSA